MQLLWLGELAPRRHSYRETWLGPQPGKTLQLLSNDVLSATPVRLLIRVGGLLLVTPAELNHAKGIKENVHFYHP